MAIPCAIVRDLNGHTDTVLGKKQVGGQSHGWSFAMFCSQRLSTSFANKHASDRRLFCFFLNVQYQLVGKSLKEEDSEGWGLNPLIKQIMHFFCV